MGSGEIGLRDIEFPPTIRAAKVLVILGALKMSWARVKPSRQWSNQLSQICPVVRDGKPVVNFYDFSPRVKLGPPPHFHFAGGARQGGSRAVAERQGWHRASQASRRGSSLRVACVEARQQDRQR